MDSYTFMQTITTNLPYIRSMFDATMALYTVVGRFDGIQVVSTESVNAAVMKYILQGDPIFINQMLTAISGLYVTLYDHTYIVTATKETVDTVIICLEDTVKPEGD